MELITSNTGIKPSMVVYGPGGAHKSLNITTFTGGPIHIIQTEPGRITPLDVPSFRKGVEDGQHAVIKVTSNEDLNKIRRHGYTDFVKHLKVPPPAMIALDSITWAVHLSMSEALSSYPPKSTMRIPEINHWMMVIEQTRQLLEALMREDAILYVVAQADLREIEEPGLKTTLWIPGVPGKYATKITHDVDMTFFVKPNQKGEMVLCCTYTGGHIGKTRGFNPGKTIPFNIDNVIKLWNASEGGSHAN